MTSARKIISWEVDYFELFHQVLVSEAAWLLKLANTKDRQNRQETDHFTVECLVAWPLNESEAGAELVLIENSLLFLC